MFCSFNHRVWFLIRLDCKWSCRKVDTLSHSVSIILKWNCFYKYVYASRMFKCNSFISLATVDVPIALSWLAVDFKTTNLCLCKPAVHLVLWNLLCHQYEGSPSIETSSHPRETLDGHFCSISEMRQHNVSTWKDFKTWRCFKVILHVCYTFTTRSTKPLSSSLDTGV